MQRFKTIIIGAGASGIVAAISSKRKGDGVLLCDRSAQIGRKILASGNGRCNLLNDKLDENHYNPEASGLVRSIFSRFDKDRIYGFFKELGLEMFSEEGRIFPVTNQAASVLKVLELELKRLSVPIELNFQVTKILESAGGFVLTSKTNQNIACDNLIICTGGKSYPALGSDGSGYILSARFGHKLIEPVPVGVPIVIKDRLCHFLQGQRVLADVRCTIDNKKTAQAAGELLFTQYGLSGTVMLDISRDVSIAVNRLHSNDVFVFVDLVPFMDKDRLKQELSKRLNKGILPQELLTGILPNKFNLPLSDLLKNKDAEVISERLKNLSFKVTGTRGWNEAEFTAGGIDSQEVNEKTLESKLKKGLYFAGEILDVDGKRGGYNLAWAWASGFVAGLTE